MIVEAGYASEILVDDHADRSGTICRYVSAFEWERAFVGSTGELYVFTG